ncbi:class A beta-lactamase [Aeromicrobium sp. CF3.5]|uniref:class A beta-lactamase n=1 Tax=Aeromicrobium sp. CF3.5 TaxID=3373078 RepID=UPI003EE7DB1A
MHGRRRFILTWLVAVLALTTAACTTSTPATPTAEPTSSTGASAAIDALQSLETRFDARVGVVAVDTGDDTTFEYRPDTRFGYASSLKVFIAAEFLRVVAPGDRTETVRWSGEDVTAAGYSPVTADNTEEGLPLDQLAEAAVRDSDNTATNLILERIGGPAGLDAALERIGDDTTEVVNTEPDLNDVDPGSTDDTTTPAAFTANLEAYLDGSVLEDRDRATLLDWMSDNATGDTLVRAGAPTGWVVADKSGGAGAMRNDVAVVTPPRRDPIIITVLTTRTDPAAEYDDELVARAAAVVLDELR